MRFKVDENLPVEIAACLEAAGYDAKTVHNQQLVGESDASLAEVCRREGRAILTLDLDFADIRSYPPEQYAGLIVLRARHQEKPRLLALFDRVIPLLKREHLVGSLWIVEEGGIRVRGPGREAQ
jgi:predicted nuclease of predicted toxin-antitoxin system